MKAIPVFKRCRCDISDETDTRLEAWIDGGEWYAAIHCQGCRATEGGYRKTCDAAVRAAIRLWNRGFTK